MRGTVIVEAFYRSSPRAALDAVLYWVAELSDAQRRTLGLELRALLARYKQGEFLRTDASRENEDRARAAGV